MCFDVNGVNPFFSASTLEFSRFVSNIILELSHLENNTARIFARIENKKYTYKSH
jgi:hypothetical protein